VTVVTVCGNGHPYSSGDDEITVSAFEPLHRRNQALEEIAAERERITKVMHERAHVQDAEASKHAVSHSELQVGFQHLETLKELFSNEPHLQAESELSGLGELLTKLAKHEAEVEMHRSFTAEQLKPSRKVDYGLLVVTTSLGFLIAWFISLYYR
jgi:hypothetical protein